jgi:hypothetical protein
VVTSVAVGAPFEALALFVAPIAPEPFVPVVFTPVKLKTVIDDATLFESVAVTVAWLNGEVAKARQISELPLCAFVRTTSVQVMPPPLILLTVVFVPERKSVATKARSNSFPDAVEKAGVVTVLLAVFWSTEIFASMPIAPHAGLAKARLTTRTAGITTLEILGFLTRFNGILLFQVVCDFMQAFAG